MKKRLLLVAFALCMKFSYAQFKLKDISYDIGAINKRDIQGKQGVWFIFNKSDSLIFAMQHFLNDTLNGYFERYWQNGKISEKGFYKKGNIDSIFIAYWENGQKRGEAYYVAGLLNGLVTSFNEKSALTSRIMYINGKVDSSYKLSFIDSSFLSDSRIRNKTDTVKTTYKSNWNKKFAIYTNDSLSKEISFYKNIIAIENFYDKTTLKKRKVYYRKKPYNIEKIYYYENGALIKTELYNKKGQLID